MKPAKPHPERHDEGRGCRATRDRNHDPRRDAAQPEGGRTRTAWANDGSAHRGAPAGLRSLPTKAKRNKGSNSRAPANVASRVRLLRPQRRERAAAGRRKRERSEQTNAPTAVGAGESDQRERPTISNIATIGSNVTDGRANRPPPQAGYRSPKGA